MHAISVKELRQKFPFVRSELAKGESFLIIHKSKPIGQLKPMSNGNGNGDSNIIISDEEKEMMEDWQNAAAQEWSKLPPLTKEEHDYYMSLPPLKD
jgi:antitoxin (DNA-binding transcriptional repressor) of toxin-antitoxin stability system